MWHDLKLSNKSGKTQWYSAKLDKKRKYKSLLLGTKSRRRLLRLRGACRRRGAQRSRATSRPPTGRATKSGPKGYACAAVAARLPSRSRVRLEPSRRAAAAGPSGGTRHRWSSCCHRRTKRPSGSRPHASSTAGSRSDPHLKAPPHPPSHPSRRPAPKFSNCSK